MYLNNFEHNNIMYSIDMIRLKTFLTYSVFSEIEFRFRTAWSKYVKKYWTTPQQKQFFYNYSIEIEEGKSFWFGFCHNTERHSFHECAEYNFTIEFNPNKIKDNKILLYLLRLSGKWFIKSFDLAMVLKINILDIITDISGRQKSTIISYGFDNKTICIGKGDGRIKIYNKKLESNLDINGDLTRVEVTREFDDFPISDMKNFDFGETFPSLYLNKYLYTFKDYEDKTLLAILFSVQNGFPIKDLSRRYQDKIRKLLEGGCKILFDRRTATQIVNKTIFHYFMWNPLVKFK